MDDVLFKFKKSLQLRDRLGLIVRGKVKEGNEYNMKWLLTKKTLNLGEDLKLLFKIKKENGLDDVSYQFTRPAHPSHRHRLLEKKNPKKMR